MSEEKAVYSGNDSNASLKGLGRIPNGAGGWRTLNGIAPALRDAESGVAGVMDGDNQGTPLWLFKRLDEEFNFDADLFANHENALCPWYFDKERKIDPMGFSERYMAYYANPPYSRHTNGGDMDESITGAMRTVERLAGQGNTVVTLTRLDPGAGWFKIIKAHAMEMRLLDLRLSFRGQHSLYNFPCVVSVFTPWAFEFDGGPAIRDWHVKALRDAEKRNA